MCGNGNFNGASWCNNHIMQKLIIGVLILFSTSVHAEWVQYFNSEAGDECFYDNARTETRGGFVYVWNRIRFAERKGVSFSFQSYEQINCVESSHKMLSGRWYTDKNWTDISTIRGEDKKRYIESESGLAALAKILCQE